MDYELARFVAAKAFRCSAELTDLVPLLKEFVSDGDEYKTYAKTISHVSAQINLVLLKELYVRYPQIEQEFNDNMQKYHFVLY